jgi:hypothetical protein
MDIEATNQSVGHHTANYICHEPTGLKMLQVWASLCVLYCLQYYNGGMYYSVSGCCRSCACLIRGRSMRGLNGSRAATTAYTTYLSTRQAGSLRSSVRRSRLSQTTTFGHHEAFVLKLYSGPDEGRDTNGIQLGIIKAVLQELMLTMREELCGQEQWSQNGAFDIVGSLIHWYFVLVRSVWFSNQRNPRMAAS